MTDIAQASAVPVHDQKTNGVNELAFTFSDLIAGYVTHFNRAQKTFGLRTSDGRDFEASLTPSAFARISQNLEEAYQDCTAHREMLRSGAVCLAYGIFYPAASGTGSKPSASSSPGGPGSYHHEEPEWWVNQIRSIADSYLKWQFGYPEKPIDYRNYRTMLHLGGTKKGDYLQETDTISRMVYGFASAYLLTGEDRFLEAAEKGTEYLREHMRSTTPTKTSSTGITESRSRATRSKSCSRRSSATTTTPSRCTSRSTRWPARPRPTASPATRGS